MRRMMKALLTIFSEPNNRNGGDFVLLLSLALPMWYLSRCEQNLPPPHRRLHRQLCSVLNHRAAYAHHTGTAHGLASPQLTARLRMSVAVLFQLYDPRGAAGRVASRADPDAVAPLGHGEHRGHFCWDWVFPAVNPAL